LIGQNHLSKANTGEKKPVLIVGFLEQTYEIDELLKP
jgi:hypothetical protein